MSFFTQRKLNKLQQAVIEGDLTRLNKPFYKLDQARLIEPSFDYQGTPCNLPELAILAGQANALAHLIQAGCDLSASLAEPLLYQAMRHPQQSLALMTVLLQADIPLNYPEQNPSHALFACFRLCPAKQLMLHLSRLNEYGADLNVRDIEGNTALILALQLDHKPLVQMLINSGAQLPEELPEQLCGEEIIGYAQRLADDLRIRQLMLG
ncbi:ankyrin repeat domain-containing protein [Amphritea sp. 1_MG-2023]|uniref:ankyrin repeat domain-containing protein n=1 Tax=Amphritea sp. 1_MG-2023 TaxID=3062670 RepID=UPI0026E2B946|nr:ankyrin repeat domain-containing protein [Amphritea sp. 1_MG-2023]MDO6564888.1 ankyrin repeat domain-containing protein [Amphritea sp. 1_MG-2023]